MSAKKHNLNPDRLSYWLHRFQNMTQEQRDEIMREECEQWSSLMKYMFNGTDLK